MTTSGTTAFDLDNLDIIEEAYERVGMEVRGGYDLRSARRSLNLLTREWGNRGLNMWTMDKVDVPYLTTMAGVVLLPSNLIDVLDAVWREDSAPNDTSMTRFSGSSWMHMANKEQTGGNPSQFFIERIAPQMRMRIWPVPLNAGTVSLWALRAIQDAGSYTNTMDVVPRFLPALVAGLAYYIGLKSPNATDRLQILKDEYDRQFNFAQEEDRERSTFRMVPDISGYNR